MIKLLDDIYTWSVFSEEKQLNFNGWFILKQPPSIGNVVIDPPKPSEEDLAQMQELGGVQQIIITNQNHIRWTHEMQEKFNSLLRINHLDAANVNLISKNNFSQGSILAGFLEAIEIPNNKSPGETALYWSLRKTLILGDALIGDPPGELRLLPKEKYADAQRAKEGIKVLLDLDFDILLVGDGDSILSSAKSTVEDFIHAN